MKRLDQVVNAPPLELNTVSPQFLPEDNDFESVRSNTFGLKEAPVFRPTDIEFCDPLGYIASIREQGEKYGIVKIIPPKTWKPNFAIDTETFWFTPRLQQVNSMEGKSRTILNYFEQLEQFHLQQGEQMPKVHTVERKVLDFNLLKKQVLVRGGFQQVTTNGLWMEVANSMGFSTASSASTLKSLFLKYILPYEIFLAKNCSRHTASCTPTPCNSVFDNSSQIDHVETGQEICETCGNGGDADQMLLCDGCNKGHHMYCLDPPLDEIPEYDWFCADCLQYTGKDYGFVDGEERCLFQFQKICNQFKQTFFQSNPKKSNGTAIVTEEQVEKEFWNLIESPFNEVEVEYGADLHTTIHGSGFPTTETEPLDKYSKCPWNLNNLPLLSNSLFQHVNRNISGMTIPWIYFGMMFSTFCWHAEDHNLYSINYLHWGETKTWYGVPSRHALLFEQTFRKNFPELFEKNKDLMFHLTTLMSPKALKENGVDVHYLDQRQGEFVVTFPRAFHAGFNQGFNCAEAVNFALADWLPFGLESVQQYSQYKKQPCFSHDQLLVAAATSREAARFVVWLLPELEKLMNRQSLAAEKLLKLYKDRLIHLKLEQDFTSYSDSLDYEKRSTRKSSASVNQKVRDGIDPTQCHRCKQFLYISDVICSDCRLISCSDCLIQTCKCQDSTIKLRKRANVDLNRIINDLKVLLEQPVQWKEKYYAVTKEYPKNIPIDQIQQLVKQGGRVAIFQFTKAFSKFAFEKSLYESLKKTLVVCDKLLKEADSVFDNLDGTSISLTYLESIISQLKSLSVYFERFGDLEQILDKAQDYQSKMLNLLASNDPNLLNKEFIDSLVSEGQSIGVLIPEINQLQLYLNNSLWTRQVQEFIEKHNLSSILDASNQMQVDVETINIPDSEKLVDIEDIMLLIDEGRLMGMKIDHPLMPALKKFKENGDKWRLDAVTVLKQKTFIVQDAKPVLIKAALVPVDTVVFKELKETFDSVNRWYKQVSDAYGGVLRLKRQQEEEDQVAENRPCIDLKQAALLLQQSFKLPLAKDPHIAMLKEDLRNLQDWEFKAKKQYCKSSSIKSFAEVLAEISKRIQASLKVKTLNPDLFCICRGRSEGFMVNCDVCSEWYHGTCIKVSKKALDNSQGYVCEICQRAETFTKSLKTINLDQISTWKKEIEDFRYNCESLDSLNDILNQYNEFKKSVYSAADSQDQASIKAWLACCHGTIIESSELCAKLRELVKPYSPSVIRLKLPIAPVKTQPIFCICRKPDDSQNAMIGCDSCGEWYHFTCLQLDYEKVKDTAEYKCPICTGQMEKPEWFLKKTKKPKTKRKQESPETAAKKVKKLPSLSSRGFSNQKPFPMLAQMYPDTYPYWCLPSQESQAYPYPPDESKPPPHFATLMSAPNGEKIEPSAKIPMYPYPSFFPYPPGFWPKPPMKPPTDTLQVDPIKNENNEKPPE